MLLISGTVIMETFKPTKWRPDNVTNQFSIKKKNNSIILVMQKTFFWHKDKL